MTPRASVRLKPPPHGSLRFGHPWVYKSQIDSVEKGIEPGALVYVIGSKGGLAGIGYYNPNSEIAVRMLTRQDEAINVDFFKARLARAAQFRSRFVRDTNAYRLVSSEADDLPGLIIDRYADTLVLQFLTLGMESLRPQVLPAIEAVIAAKGIYERSDAPYRNLEGLEEKTGWISQSCADQALIVEGGIRYSVRFGEGHKTGFYLDQRENRLALAGLGIQGDVLDAFCYEGGFGLHLARSGCRVLGLDIRTDALERAAENRQLNGLSEASLRFKSANVFDELKSLDKEAARFDLVILDPPSFVKKKSAIEGAASGYKEIMLRAMKILKQGGLLAVFSCSYHVNEDVLMQAAMSAAHDVRRSLRLVKFFKQSADHPINPFIPETYYLKGFLFEVNLL